MPHMPAYRWYKPKNLGVVRINGRDRYLGRYDSPESWEKYHRLIAELIATATAEKSGCATNASPASPVIGSPLTVNRLILGYLEFARGYYVKDGAPTKEFVSMRDALRPLKKLFGTTLVCQFGPKALKLVRDEMIANGWSRQFINRTVNRIKRVFKWSVAEELVRVETLQALQTVPGLRYGRTTARDTEPVKPVPDEFVGATLPYMSEQVAAMVRLQRIAGMRPCEVVLMRGCDLNMQGPVWLYEPAEHKNRWRGHQRQIPLGPKAQQILTPWLRLETTAYLFSPRDAEAARNLEKRRNRRSKMTPSQARRVAKAKPKRAKRERYDVDSYRRAIKYAIDRANRGGREVEQIPSWSPLQLRHSRATEVRRTFGLEGAQVALGHAHANVTEIYAERNLELAMRIASQTG